MKKYSHIISLLIILGIAYWSLYSLMPQNYTKENTPPEKFAAERALVHVRAIAQKPHYVGSEHHKEVQKYIVDELKKLGLYPEIQEGYTFDKWKTLSSPQNIIARIKGSGNGEALLLLSHYDSDPHSATGASDAASGVATILEGIRAFNASKLKPKNDIIILITDGEELGLSGAELFVKKHPWAKDIRVILNFEARGSGGPSYMFIETNGGNAKMIDAFKEAGVKYPAATSLAYSIYKMMPNDTDLTVFREQADINGFNFAFIDDHFDYHTARDTYENLDKNTLEHQGTYLMPLLTHFSYSDLNDIKSMEDDVYFNTPLGMFSYPFMWIFPMLIIAVAAFGFLLYLGFKTKRLSVKHIFLGFIPFLIALVVSALITNYGWVLLLGIYPQYNEISQGFPYNGHGYIAAFVVFTLAVCFMSYSWFKTRERVAGYVVAPLFIWLIINVFVALYLKGAAFFIIPVYFGLLLFYFLIKYEKPNSIALGLLAFPIIVLMVPFIPAFPVGLGLDILAVCALLITLIFGLLLPVTGFYTFKRSLAALCFILFGFFIVKAHFSSHFNENRQKPNSMVYVFNADENAAQWATYDNIPDEWTGRKLGDNPQKASGLNKNIILSKYGNAFTYAAEAPLKNIPPPKVDIAGDTLIGNDRHVEICITPQRPIHRMDIFADDASEIASLFANGEQIKEESSGKINKNSGRLLISYYPHDNMKYLELRLTMPKNKNISLEINEMSFDLLEHEQFTISPRSRDMIPRPFVINDAILIKKTIKL